MNTGTRVTRHSPKLQPHSEGIQVCTDEFRLQKGVVGDRTPRAGPWPCCTVIPVCVSKVAEAHCLLTGLCEAQHSKPEQRNKNCGHGTLLLVRLHRSGPGLVQQARVKASLPAQTIRCVRVCVRVCVCVFVCVFVLGVQGAKWRVVR